MGIVPIPGVGKLAYSLEADERRPLSEASSAHVVSVGESGHDECVPRLHDVPFVDHLLQIVS